MKANEGRKRDGSFGSARAGEGEGPSLASGPCRVTDPSFSLPRRECGQLGMEKQVDSSSLASRHSSTRNASFPCALHLAVPAEEDEENVKCPCLSMELYASQTLR